MDYPDGENGVTFHKVKYNHAFFEDYKEYATIAFENVLCISISPDCTKIAIVCQTYECRVYSFPEITPIISFEIPEKYFTIIRPCGKIRFYGLLFWQHEFNNGCKVNINWLNVMPHVYSTRHEHIGTWFTLSMGYRKKCNQLYDKYGWSVKLNSIHAVYNLTDNSIIAYNSSIFENIFPVQDEQKQIKYCISNNDKFIITVFKHKDMIAKELATGHLKQQIPYTIFNKIADYLNAKGINMHREYTEDEPYKLYDYICPFLLDKRFSEYLKKKICNAITGMLFD